MDIAKMSMALANHQVRQDASMLMAKKVMNIAEDGSEQLLEMMNASVAQNAPHPTSGKSIDLHV